MPEIPSKVTTSPPPQLINSATMSEFEETFDTGLAGETEFSVHPVRHEGEDEASYATRVLAEAGSMEEDTREERRRNIDPATGNPFQPRQTLRRTPVLTSTPAARMSPTGLNLGAGITPISSTTEQRYEEFREAAEVRGEKTLSELKRHVERLQAERDEAAERQRLLREQQQLEDELAFEREAEVRRQEERDEEVRARRKAARDREYERMARLAEEQEEELAELERNRKMRERLAALEARRHQLESPVPSVAPSVNSTRPPSPILPLRRTIIREETVVPEEPPLMSNIQSSTSQTARVPVTSVLETAYRRVAPVQGGMSDERFDGALKRLGEAMTNSKGHVYKVSTDVQKYEDWIQALDELLLEADLLQEERLTDIQRLRLVAVLARTCLDREDRMVNERWRVVKEEVTTVKEFKRTFGERFLGRDPMRGLWERWEKCTQGTRRFDNFYHEVMSLARQLKGISPELTFRKLKAATDPDVRFKAHEKTADLAEGQYQELARLYALADEAIRDLAKEKKAGADKRGTSDKQKGGPNRGGGSGGTANTSGTGGGRTVVATTTTVTEKLGQGRTPTVTAKTDKRDKGLSSYISPEDWARLTPEQKREVFNKRQAARATVKAVTVAGRGDGSSVDTSTSTIHNSGQPQPQQARGARSASIKAVQIPPVGTDDKGMVSAQGDLRARGPVMSAWIDVAGKQARVNLDSGTTNTILNDRFVTLHNIPRSYYEKPGRTNLAFRGSKGSIVAYCNPGVTINGEYLGTCTMEIGAVDGWDALVGTDFLHKFGCMLDLVAMEASYRSPTRGCMLMPLASTEEAVQTLALVKVPRGAPPTVDLDRSIVIKRIFDSAGIPEYDNAVAYVDAWTGSDEEIVHFVRDYGFRRGVFREDGKLPKGWLPPLRYLDDGTDMNHRWDYIDPSKRPHTKPFRYPARYESQIAEKCADYQTKGIWFDLTTDDVIPTFCVPKKDPSKARLVFDERQRNANRVKDKTPLPNMQNIVFKAHDADHMSQLDLIVAYEQLRLTREMEKFSGFTTPWGAKGTRVGSMGDCNMPGSFQRNMNVVAGHHLGIHIFPYLDNLVVATKGSLKHHLRVMLWLIERLREGEWFIGEVELNAVEMEVLGYIVGKGSRKPGPRVLNPIVDAPPPKTIAAVDRMLGAYNFCAQHGTAKQATAKTYLSEATKYRTPGRGKEDHRKFPPYTVNGKFVWTPACQEAWEQLKNDMMKCLRLQAFKPEDPKLRTYLITDASLTGMAGYVAQGPVEGTWEDSWAIEVWARAFTPAETNYSTTVQEKLAVGQALTHFEHLLRGVQFTLCTDHKALVGQGTTGKPSTDRKLARWQTYIDTFAMDYCHIPGDGNLLADTLSRVWEGYTHDEIEPKPVQHSDAWRWNMAKTNALSLPGEGNTDEAAKAAEPLVAPSNFEELEGTALVKGELLDVVFGTGCSEALAKAQKVDKLYAAAYESPGAFKNFKAEKGSDELLRFNGRVVVPLQYRWNGKLFTRLLVEYVHLEKAHVGARDTLAGLKGWFWEHQVREVKEYVKECDACQRAKHRSTAPPGQHVAMPITAVSGFRHVAWDFQGPLPESKDVDGIVKTALWNVLARGTGYVLMVPIKHDVSAEDLARIFVEKIYPVTGIPESVLSDRDARFTSAFWTAVVKQLPMEGLMTTAFHPRGNGGIEGKHRIVNMAMSAIVDVRQQNWVECVPHVQFRMNCTKSSTTGYTPFELTYGYVPTLFPVLQDMPVGTSAEAKAFLEKTATARKDAEDAIVVARLKQTNYANESRGATPVYKPGDKVLLSTENLNLRARGEAGAASKWKHRWVGPFDVVKQEGTTVELKLPHAWAELHPRFHVELLRPYHGAPGRYDEPPPELDSEGVPIYEVEKILNHRWNGRRKRFEWRVKWVGYPDSENTWEPLENLVGAADLLKNYRAKHGPETKPSGNTGSRKSTRLARTNGIVWADDVGEDLMDFSTVPVFQEDL